jgi:serine/threonine protein kinase
MSEQLIKTPGLFGENQNFLLERELGSGGMGGVYLGRDKMLDRTVAVKVMLKEFGSDAEFVEKFKKEAQAAARLIHPNIAQIYSYGISDGMPYIAMELASGGSLFSLMNASPGKIDIQRTLKICQQVAQALQCASDQGFVHGDVKPENILLDANGNAKLVDFGLAAMQKDTEEIWGTPYYIAPEKVKKEALDFRADMYSLGGTLYHALTGSAPFEGTDSVAVVKKRFEITPRKPSELRPEISPAIDALVMKMLAFDRNDRFPSFEALIQEIKNVLASGLTQNIPAANDGSQSPSKPSQSAQAGRRVVMRGGRRVVLKRSSTAVKSASTEESEEKEEVSSKKRIRPGRVHVERNEDEDEEEEGGNLAVKVLLFVLGGILFIAAIVGGLFWYIHHTKEVEQRRIADTIEKGIAAASVSIADMRSKTEKVNVELQDFAKKSIVECEKFTVTIAKELPTYAQLFRPQPSEKLLKAIASTNAPVEKVESSSSQTNAPNATAESKTADKQEASSENKLSIKDRAKAVGLEVPKVQDKADPEYQDFLVKLKEAEEKAAAEKAKPKEEEPSEEKKEEEEPPAMTEIEKKKDTLVKDSLPDIHEIWTKAYDCQACAIFIDAKAKKIIGFCDEASASATNVERQATLDKLSKMTSEIKSMYEELTGSKDVEEMRKGMSFIKSKGRSTIRKISNSLRTIKLEEERRIARENAEKAEKERAEKLAAERAALVQSECLMIKEKFEAIVAQGCFRQLDWSSAYRMLKDTSSSFKTPEGEFAAKMAVRTVDMMKSVQDIFINRAKGHTFKGALKGAKIVEINEKDIMILKPNGKQKQRIQWQKFYLEYPGNLNELINHYIVRGRKNSNLTLKGWADAMLGASLTMKLVCTEVNGALMRAQQLAKEVLAAYPEYKNAIDLIFPGLKTEQSADEE